MMFVHTARGAAFSAPHSALLWRDRRRYCFLTALLPLMSHHNQNCLLTMAALILILYPGSIRTAVITSRRVRTWNLRTSSISEGVSPGALISSVWAPTIKAIASRSAHEQLTTDLCRENTLQAELSRQAHSLIYDSPCFRGRLLRETKSTIFIPRLRLQGCIG
jgi:hypothetical protein